MKAASFTAAEVGICPIPYGLSREDAMIGIIYNAERIRARRIIDMATAGEIANGTISSSPFLEKAGASKRQVVKSVFDRVRAQGIASMRNRR